MRIVDAISPTQPEMKSERIEGEEFEEKVETLQKEAGSQWLVILNELQRVEEKSVDQFKEFENVQKMVETEFGSVQSHSTVIPKPKGKHTRNKSADHKHEKVKKKKERKESKEESENSSQERSELSQEKFEKYQETPTENVEKKQEPLFDEKVEISLGSEMSEAIERIESLSLPPHSSPIIPTPSFSSVPQMESSTVPEKQSKSILDEFEDPFVMMAQPAPNAEFTDTRLVAISGGLLIEADASGAEFRRTDLKSLIKCDLIEDFGQDVFRQFDKDTAFVGLTFRVEIDSNTHKNLNYVYQMTKDDFQKFKEQCNKFVEENANKFIPVIPLSLFYND